MWKNHSGMPLISPSSYLAPPGFGNGHVQTIYARLFRRVAPLYYARERIATADGDFLDLDWSRAPLTTAPSKRLAVLCHGLEGSSEGTYIVAMAHAVNGAGWDALAWNYRGCSGEVNRRPRYYHSGATDDLEAVIRHGGEGYEEIALIGFSLGGNLILKYAGEQGSGLDPRIRRVVAFSVPCDLGASAEALSRGFNRVYLGRFLASLKQKVEAKAHLLPPHIHTRDYHRIRTFQDFDDRYTAPLHGFRDARDYWTRCSSRQFLPAIRVPTLLVNARNDPFLTERCLPFEEARANPMLFLEVPDSGGHVGFVSFGSLWWTERRTLDFLEQEVAA
jgi:predicted alpha/beta-fold hydrolase